MWKKNSHTRHLEMANHFTFLSHARLNIPRNRLSIFLYLGDLEQTLPQKLSFSENMQKFAHKGHFGISPATKVVADVRTQLNVTTKCIGPV